MQQDLDTTFRLATEADLDRLVSLEQASYPANEAASRESIQQRLQQAGAFFRVMEARSSSDSTASNVIGFINGTLTSHRTLTHDTMSTHVPDGAYLCIHSVVVDTDYRRRGLATRMLNEYTAYIQHSQRRVKAALLIAKEHLAQPFYVRKGGFQLVGKSSVVHGDDPWWECAMDFDRSVTCRAVPTDAPQGASNVRYEPMPPNSGFVKPVRMHFDLSFLGRAMARSWDIVESFNAVAVLLYHRDAKGFILVKQFRPAVFARCSEEQRAGDPECGFTYELCAGLKDKGKSDEQTAREEIEEECGYAVTEPLHYITSARGNVGVTGNQISLFYAEVDESMRVSEGGGNPDEGELIDVVLLPEDQAMAFLLDDRLEKPSSIAFAFFWYFSVYRAGKLGDDSVRTAVQPTTFDPSTL